MKHLYSKALILSFLLIVILQAPAQNYYPGGLGKTNLFLWLNAANSGSVSRNGAGKVSQWSDLSGKGNDATAGSSSRPVYGATASPNNKPAIGFNGDNSQYLSLGTLSNTLSFTNGVSAFAMASFDAPGSSYGWQRIFDFGNGDGDDNFMMGRYGATANLYYEGWKNNSGDQSYTTTGAITNGAANLFESIQQGGTAGNLTNVNHYIAGASQTASGQAGSSKTYLPAATSRSSNYIGRSNWTSDDYFSGTMSEILLYNTAMNSTQRVILENYLSTSWNKSVSTDIYTPASATTYTTNLVAIGYTSSTDNALATVAGSTDGLGFSSGTTTTDFLHSAGYLAAAHNAQNNTVISNTTLPGLMSGSAISRWNRSWRMQRTSGTAAGNVTVVFNFADYNSALSAPSGTAVYALVYNATDGSFATGTNQLITTTATTVSGSTVSFRTAASSLATGYYTIAYSTSPIVLPVTLTSFTATQQEQTAVLEFTAIQPAGFSHFEIQRAADGADFASIGTVAGNANSDDYTFTDGHPLAGKNYYRLAMVDADGTTTYSAIRVLTFETAGGAALTMSVYPNPVADRLHLVFTHISGTIGIRLLNSQGMVTQATTANASTTVDISVSGLSRGVYFVEIRGADGIHITKEIYKQ
ncbi:T9SS type A sorting domain-containing protein [Puia sp.]|uniref:T9SS type A sorting domain-containing protein n=1 Tax=Puia sp. TaxID=2045100 RepID=UPI002F3EAB10